MQTVFSGVQPTGNLHLGNYLGAIKNWVQLQEQYNCIFCVVDLHAITVPQNPSELQESIINTAAMYIACGVDPAKSIIFQQSSVSGHAELAWLLNCNTPMGWLNRMTQFKDKAGKNKEKAPLGLYAYPVLMAADILLYGTNLVPVGDDQKQHLELARDIATSFNHHYNNDIFTVPEPLIQGAAARVMSLKNGTNKMSKSDPSEYSRINLTDSDDEIITKLKKAKTDAIEGITYDEQNRPEVSNLINIYCALTDTKKDDAVAYFADYNFAKFKTELGEVFSQKIGAIRNEYLKITQDKGELLKVLNNGQQQANELAQAKLKKVKQVIGL